jgi:hypothetical protein
MPELHRVRPMTDFSAISPGVGGAAIGAAVGLVGV